MGLDMYLYGMKYFPPTYDKDGNIRSPRQKLMTEVANWRKANQIHRWFVEEIQNYEDDCREYEVTLDKLKELRDACKTVLSNKTWAKDILPTMAGFFFGPTDYDEYYFEDLEYTVKRLNEIIKNENEYDWFIYQSSW